MKIKIVGQLVAVIFILSSISCGLLPGTPTAVSTTGIITQPPLPTETSPAPTIPPTEQPPNTQSAAAAPTALPPTIPPPSMTADPRMILIGGIKEIHNQYEFDSRGCLNNYGDFTPYEESRNEIITMLLSHPSALTLPLEERSTIYNEVTGAFHMEFVPGSGDAILVKWFSDCRMNRFQSAHNIVVFDQGTIFDLSDLSLVYDIRWIADRWVLLNRLKLDSVSGPTPWSIWQIGNVGGSWQKVVDWSFVPTPYNFDGINLDFENGYETMIAEVEYWYDDHPCEFNSAFTDTFKHGDWKVKNTYHLTGDQYELTDTQMLDFPVTSLDTNEPVTINWQDYCVNAEP